MLSAIKLSAIRLYLANPRYSESVNELEELFKVVADQKKKLVRLAEDIAINGLSELDVIAVFPDNDKGFYRVAEGNRRITALKLLQNPDIIKDRFPVIHKDFTKISIGSGIDFEHINVSIFPSEGDLKLQHFLEARHLGEQGGVGTVRWNARQKARFDYRVYGKENLVIFLDELECKCILTSEQISGVTKTNWERILRPVGLNFLKLIKEKRTYKVHPGYENEFKEKIRMVADSLKGESVGIVYGQTQIDDFFKRMDDKYAAAHGGSSGTQGHEPYGINTGPFRHGFSVTAGSEASGGNNVPPNTNATTGSPSNSPNPRPKLPPDPYKNCQTVIPPIERLQSRNHRITLIIEELKKLEVERYPNACGCLLRALIELSAKEYLAHNSATKSPNNDATSMEFQDAIAAASNLMIATGALTKDEARSLRQETDNGGVRQLFNGYMHNKDSYPNSVVIKGIFQTYCKFLRQCLL